MALTSPGVQVSVIDESFYTPAEPGTTPIIFVATAQDKLNGAGTGIAPGTTAANAGKVFLMTSQRDLVETFGDPAFYTDSNNNPIHGGEQNEYGLQAAYSYLGVSNRAYIVRADVDLANISASATPTTANPADGTWWFDTQTTLFGIQEWNSAAITTTGGQTFANKTPLVITDKTQLVGGSATGAPKGSVGVVGDYAVRATTTTLKTYYKNKSGAWVEVGSALWKKSWPSVTSTAGGTTGTGETFTLNGTTVTTSGTSLSTMASDINGAGVAGVTAAVVDNKLEIYNDGSGQDTIVLADGTGTPLTDVGITAGTYYNTALSIAPHTSVPEYKSGDSNPRPSGSLWIKTTEPNLGASWKIRRWNGATETWDLSASPLYTDNATAIQKLDNAGGGANLATNAVYIKYNAANDTPELASYYVYYRASAGATSVISNKVTATTFSAGALTFTVSESLKGNATMTTPATASFTATGAESDADLMAEAVNNLGLVNVSATVDSQNRVTISHRLGGEVNLVDTDNALTAAGFVPGTTANLYWQPGEDGSNPEKLTASLWKGLSYTASANAPTALAADGALWYSSVIDEVDIMIHDGTKWTGYLNADSPVYNATPSLAPSAAGPIVSASEPDNSSRPDGNNLVTGDIWISTADLENFPKIYVYNAALAGNKWVLLDNTDQTTENGVLFADARWSTNGGTATSHTEGDIADLIASNFVDTDCPDPALYPKGMLLWNTRKSGFNVKKFVRNYVDISGVNVRMGEASMANYYPHRWVTESANNADGSGAFGRIAQRKVVVQALQSMINSNDDIRDDESRIFNLIATPGYPELIGEMISLNADRGLTAFVVGDSPMRLAPDATSLNNWATNQALAPEDNDDGLVTRDEYLGVYYPSGFTSDNSGNNVVVPPSHMVLRTMALNDQVAFPWFAPAGTRRGGVNNATATGFINGEGEFVSVALNEGQRDTLYQNNVNPITFLTGAGLVVFGQKTRARAASALDRVNVARLTVYLRSQLNQLAKPYLFEPNDKITRDEIKQQVESLMIELVGLRALYDFLVVCDETNNTPARIDRNELYVDIAVEPVKAVEFIYIPLRLKNTGEIAGL
mgnify:CR=1 FL=1|jgi:hypothetical protein|tara:strand:- start:4795 stop:8070 length:3276 start_codon:yes stop_codon:yes gene_type:complete